MQNEDRSLFELFDSALTQKLISTIERLCPSPCLLLLSKSLEPLIQNPRMFQTIKDSRVRLFFLETLNPELFKPESNNIVLLCSAHVPVLKHELILLDAINNSNPGRPFKFHLLVQPRRTYLTKLYLESSPFVELFRKVKSIIDLNLDFVPLDYDLLALSFPFAEAEFPFNEKRGYRVYNKLFRESDFEQHLLCAEALEKLQTIFGSFESIATKGQAADGIWQLLCYSELSKKKLLNPKGSLFGNLLIIDRSVDLITPFITQWTFQGLVDQSVGITFGTVTLPKRFLGGDKESQETKDSQSLYYLLDPSDKLLVKLRDCHWSRTTPIIQETIKSLSDLRNNQQVILGAEKANEVLELVRQKRFLDIHVQFQTRIEAYLKSHATLETVQFEQEILYSNQLPYFERLVELVQIELPLENVLRLIALTNFCLRGFTEDQYIRLHKEMIESYGPGVLRSLLQMERNGLFVNSEDPEANLRLIKLNDLELYKMKFKIINEGVNPADQQDLSFAFSGYTPILVRIVENLITANPKAPKVKFRFSPGSSKTDFLAQRGLLLFIYGGITWAEMACLRRLARILDRRLMVVTTEVINAQTIPRAFISEMDFK